MAVERTVDTGVRLMYRVQRFLETPGLKLPYMVEKVGLRRQQPHAAGAAGGAAGRPASPPPVGAGRPPRRAQRGDCRRRSGQIVANRWFLGGVGALLFLTVRKILFRLNDKGAAAA